jgi:hypothetical protein
VSRSATTSRLVLAACALVLGAAAARILLHDPTSLPVSGDQASFTYQALSLRGGDLAYDATDQRRWLDLGWSEQPHGLFVQQRDDGWAFAKPLGYSVVLAPALAVAGARGISIVGAALLLAYAGCWYGVGRLRWDVGTAALVATAATVASHAWFFGFPAHADLFVAVLVGLAALGASRAALSEHDRVAWSCLAMVAAGLLVTEKLPALVALAPVLVVALVRVPSRARLLAIGAGAAVIGLSVLPYLFYSDGSSWNAYGGDRFYAPGTTPWSGGTEADLTPWRTRDSLSPDYVLDQLRDPDDEMPSAALTYAVGRHTGVATFMPIVPALAGAAAVAAWRRRHDRGASRGDPRSPGIVGAAAAVGLLAYVALYLVAFTTNYFGGGQSVGNRYFLQVSALVPVVAVTVGVTVAVARWCTAAAAAWAMVVLGAQMRHPEEAFYRIDRTTAAQRLLPFDGSQEHAWRFECEPATCVPPPLEPYGDG